jgi:FMN phosphatase YigB (HAD superfamily)
MQNRPKTLLIDLDGVMVRHHSKKSYLNFVYHNVMTLRKYVGLYNAFQVMKKARLSLEAKNTSLTNKEKVIQSMNNFVHDNEKAKELYRICMQENFIKHLATAFTPFAHRGELVDQLAQKYQLILTTNPIWPKEVVEQRLKWGEIEPRCFEHLTTSEVMHSIKPQVSYYQEVLEMFNLKPTDVIMIGDSVKKDGPATNCGINTFIITPHSSHKDSDFEGLNSEKMHFVTFDQLAKDLL